jgi:hypothetical protein
MAHRDPKYKGAGAQGNYTYKRPDKKKEWHWSLTFTIAGLIIGTLFTIIIMRFTFLSVLYLIFGILVVGAIAFILQWKKFYSPEFIQKHFRLPIAIYALYNFAGIGMTASALFLSLNWIGASSQQDKERYLIKGLDHDYIIDSNYLVVLLLENDAYKDDPGMRSTPFNDAMARKEKPFFDILKRKGLFGIYLYDGWTMSPDPNAKPEPVVEEEIIEEPEIVQDTLTVDSLVTE